MAITNPKTSAKSDTTSKVNQFMAQTNKIQPVTAKDIVKMRESITEGVSEGIKEAVSNKNQSSPGKTSGGFSYKLKKD
jgi:hypothetical protein